MYEYMNMKIVRKHFMPILLKLAVCMSIRHKTLYFHYMFILLRVDWVVKKNFSFSLLIFNQKIIKFFS